MLVIDVRLKDKILYIWNDDICEGTNRKAVKSFMKANKLYHSGNKISMIRAMLLNNRNIKKYNCEIYPQATIGEGFYIPHCVGIVVGSTTVIGKNCTIYPNVVFGAKYSPSQKNPDGRRHALVGDNCVFGANSSIMGDITIGDNVTVGAGAIVTKDVPSDSIVTGVNCVRSK